MNKGFRLAFPFEKTRRRTEILERLFFSPCSLCSIPSLPYEPSSSEKKKSNEFSSLSVSSIFLFWSKSLHSSTYFLVPYSTSDFLLALVGQIINCCLSNVQRIVFSVDFGNWQVFLFPLRNSRRKILVRGFESASKLYFKRLVSCLDLRGTGQCSAAGLDQHDTYIPTSINIFLCFHSLSRRRVLHLCSL